MVLVTNNQNKEVNPENYDKVIYLGFTPSKVLAANEVVVVKFSYNLANWLISLKGYTKTFEAVSKKDLEYNYKEGINQIVLGESTKQCSHTTETGEEIIFIPLNGHKEIEISNEL